MRYSEVILFKCQVVHSKRDVLSCPLGVSKRANCEPESETAQFLLFIILKSVSAHEDSYIRHKLLLQTNLLQYLGVLLPREVSSKISFTIFRSFLVKMTFSYVFFAVFCFIFIFILFVCFISNNSSSCGQIPSGHMNPSERVLKNC